jgi:hypothetical protein
MTIGQANMAWGEILGFRESVWGTALALRANVGMLK